MIFLVLLTQNLKNSTEQFINPSFLWQNCRKTQQLTLNAQALIAGVAKIHFATKLTDYRQVFNVLKKQFCVYRPARRVWSQAPTLAFLQCVPHLIAGVECSFAILAPSCNGKCALPAGGMHLSVWSTSLGLTSPK